MGLRRRSSTLPARMATRHVRAEFAGVRLERTVITTTQQRACHGADKPSGGSATRIPAPIAPFPRAPMPGPPSPLQFCNSGTRLDCRTEITGLRRQGARVDMSDEIMAKRIRRTPRPDARPSDPLMLCQSIMESVADGVLAVDSDRNITAFNPAAAAITGVPCDQAIGRKCFDVLRGDGCVEVCPAREAMATGATVTGRRVTILNADGKETIVSISAAPLRNSKGHVVGGVETFRDLSALEGLRKELAQSYTYGDIVGKSASMRQLFRILPPIAESESTVLIEGESGTGKELFARAVHDLSPRQEGPYVVVNCGALPETLLESELFGYKRGAFTDAKKDKPGKFELAKGGSIFLDEIETLTPAVQVKLLRVIQEREFEPLGGTRPVRANVRIIAASNRRLRDLVATGRFRDDLYYRLNVVTLDLPPLRDRRDDTPLLVDHFVRHFNLAKGKEIAGVSPSVMRALMAYDFPGNVRELQNIIEHAFVLCDGRLIELHHVPRAVGEQEQDGHLDVPPKPGLQTSGLRPLADAEAAAIRATLARNRGHRTRTAADLGVSPSTLWRKMKRYGIDG
jgi:PAS domain S-box-containing protein